MTSIDKERMLCELLAMMNEWIHIVQLPQYAGTNNIKENQHSQLYCVYFSLHLQSSGS